MPQEKISTKKSFFLSMISSKKSFFRNDFFKEIMCDESLLEQKKSLIAPKTSNYHDFSPKKMITWWKKIITSTKKSLLGTEEIINDIMINMLISSIMITFPNVDFPLRKKTHYLVIMITKNQK